MTTAKAHVINLKCFNSAYEHCVFWYAWFNLGVEGELLLGSYNFRQIYGATSYRHLHLLLKRSNGQR